MNNQKQIHKTLQVLLWLWFGVITSFVSANVVNIAKIETEIKNHNEMLINKKSSCAPINF